MAENKVLKHLMEAFAGESQANRKYLAYAKKAEAEGKKMQPNFLGQLLKQKLCMLKDI